MARHLEDPSGEGSSPSPGGRWAENQRTHIAVLVTAHRDELDHGIQWAARFQRRLQPVENSCGPRFCTTGLVIEARFFFPIVVPDGADDSPLES